MPDKSRTCQKSHICFAPMAPAQMDYENLEMDCLHCDYTFEWKYLLWHYRHRNRKDDSSILRCPDCRCMTPVRWHFDLADAAAFAGRSKSMNKSERAQNEVN